MKTRWIILLLAYPAAAQGADWQQFRGPNGNGIVHEKCTLLPRPKKLWDASVGSGNASLVIQDGRLYTTGNFRGRGSVLLCLDSSTGKQLWDKQVDSWSSDSSPALARDRGFLLCNKGKETTVLCFRLSDGKTIWRKELPEQTAYNGYGHSGSPLLWRDLVIVNAGSGTALKQATGAIVWEQRGLNGLATPVLYQEKDRPAVLLFAGTALVARDAASGRELWSIPWKTDGGVNASDPIYHRGKLFLSTSYGKYAALFDLSSGSPKQVWKDRGSSFSNDILWKDHLFHFASGQFCCLDFASGEKKWNGPQVGHGSVLLADDKLLLLSEHGRLYVAPASAERFRPVLEARIHNGTTWAPPSLVKGRLFVRNKEGGAVCLQIGE